MDGNLCGPHATHHSTTTTPNHDPIDAIDRSLQVRELLDVYKFDGESITFVRGSALCALEGKNDELGKDAVLALMAAVDKDIADPVREVDKPFTMAIEGVFSIAGRGTVATGRIESVRSRRRRRSSPVGAVASAERIDGLVASRV